jgi:hypothetical protein
MILPQTSPDVNNTLETGEQMTSFEDIDWDNEFGESLDSFTSDFW